MNAVKSSTNAVRLDPRRVEQLKSIGAKLGMTNAGVVAHLIRSQIDAGVITDEVPGVIVRKLADGVFIQIDDNEPATVAFDTARKIVETIRSVANGGSGIVNVSPTDASKSYSVVRQGTGIKLQIPFHGPDAKRWTDAPAFPADLAHDIASLIEKAA